MAAKKADLILFSSQIFLITITVVVCLVNLSLQYGEQNLWTVLLTSLLGYVMPNPRIKVEDGKTTIRSTNSTN